MQTTETEGRVRTLASPVSKARWTCLRQFGVVCAEKAYSGDPAVELRRDGSQELRNPRGERWNCRARADCGALKRSVENWAQ